uniref:Tetraspanin 14 n=1 Tax=Macaca mulatta TaxID=9544 RepID=A0A5F8ATJ1_MACMU
MREMIGSFLESTYEQVLGRGFNAEPVISLVTHLSADSASQKMHYYRYSNAKVSCWYKYLLFSYNIIFWLAGVVFLGVGLWAWSEKGVLSDLTKVTRMHGIDPVVLVLMVGVVMFTLGFAGCVGALRENICLLNFFCGTIVLIFFLELAVAVLAFLFQDWVRDRFREFFESNIKSYRDDIDLQNLIDSLQKANQCCGAYGPEDWDLNVYFNCSGASYSREKCGVPFSCCVPDPAQKVVNTQCGYDVRIQLKSKWDESIFTKGCIQALESWLPRNIYIVAGVFIAISLLQETEGGRDHQEVPGCSGQRESPDLGREVESGDGRPQGSQSLGGTHPGGIQGGPVHRAPVCGQLISPETTGTGLWFGSILGHLLVLGAL